MSKRKKNLQDLTVMIRAVLNNKDFSNLIIIQGTRLKEFKPLLSEHIGMAESYDLVIEISCESLSKETVGAMYLWAETYNCRCFVDLRFFGDENAVDFMFIHENSFNKIPKGIDIDAALKELDDVGL